MSVRLRRRLQIEDFVPLFTDGAWNVFERLAGRKTDFSDLSGLHLLDQQFCLNKGDRADIFSDIEEVIDCLSHEIHKIKKKDSGFLVKSSIRHNLYAEYMTLRGQRI